MVKSSFLKGVFSVVEGLVGELPWRSKVVKLGVFVIAKVLFGFFLREEL